MTESGAITTDPSRPSLERRREPLVGVVTQSLSSSAGGMFFSIRIPRNIMEMRGIRQMIFGIQDHGLERERAAWEVTSLNVFRGYGPSLLKFSPGLLRGLDRVNVDILHLHGIWNFASFAAFRWKRRHDKPLVISPHGMLDAGALAFSPRKKWLAKLFYERRNLEKCAALHALNEAEAVAARAFGIRAPIAVIPNGVLLPDDTVIDQRDWGSDQRRTMLFLARIHPKKGVEALIAAWRRMLQLRPELATQWRLVIAGWDDGGHFEAAKRQIVDLGLADHVEMPGAVFDDAKDELLARSHAFILPSLSEGLPIGVLEGWGYGLPVFMTEQCNMPVGFAEGAAIRIEAAAEPLAATLAEHLGGSMEPLIAMGRRGRALAAREFSWHAIVDQYLELYQWLHDPSRPVPDFVRLNGAVSYANDADRP